MHTKYNKRILPFLRAEVVEIETFVLELKLRCNENPQKRQHRLLFLVIHRRLTNNKIEWVVCLCKILNAN